jgi:aminoglycoside phosphotransferase family enzyme/predicted kinase
VSAGLPEAFESLLHPQAYPHPVRSVKLVETHISWVLLTGEFAYKIKRPVHFDFVDLRAPERRAFLCQEEVRLNRRFAPGIYLGVSAVTRGEKGEAELDGAGAVLEHAVKMRQFAREEELDRLLATRRVDAGELERFGCDLARIHARAAAAGSHESWGTPEAVRETILGNLEECTRLAEQLGFDRDIRSLRPPLEARLDRAASLMAQRRAAGRIRECHGDLHAANIVRQGAHLTAFDCLEFEPRWRWIDVADEIAFLIADLDARQCSGQAHAFWSGYLAESGDYQTCRLLRTYAAHRALVRAKVAVARALQAQGRNEPQIAPGRSDIDAYLGCAHQTLAEGRPVLILMHGLSGSGKTWLARRIAPSLRAAHLRSDVERKRLGGMPEPGHASRGVGMGAYSADSTDRVYRHLAQCAAEVLCGGYSAIVDATFIRRRDRLCVASIGRSLGVGVVLIDCRAPGDTLESRINDRRQHGNDASEADLGVLRWQQGQFEPLSPDEPFRIIEAETHVAHVETRVLAALTGIV